MTLTDLDIRRNQLLDKAARFALDQSNDGDPEHTHYAAQLAILDAAIERAKRGEK
jgi:hypothetical protein